LIPPEKYIPKIPKGIPNEFIMKILQKEIPIPSMSVGQSIACGILAAEAINYLGRGKSLTCVPKYISFSVDL